MSNTGKISSAVPSIHNDPDNKSVSETAAAGISTLASHVDPFPHYLVGALTGAAGAYAYYGMRQPQTALIAGGLSGAFLYAGYLLNSGDHRAGYMTGALASAALLGASFPRAYRTMEAYPVMMAGLGAISTLGNTIKYNQIRTGHPRDLHIHSNAKPR